MASNDEQLYFLLPDGLELAWPCHMHMARFVSVGHFRMNRQ
jgi:hypothetical protein